MFDKYFKSLYKLSEKLEVTDQKQNLVDSESIFSKIKNLFESLKESNNKIIFIGNGGSAAISSHLSTDYSKNGGIRAISLNDSSLLTCFANDYCYEKVFEEALRIYADKGDMLIAISSSGASSNIINAAKKARSLECTVVTLSGFKGDNPLRKLGEVNFYVPSLSYGQVEICHLAILHSLLDRMMGIDF